MPDYQDFSRGMSPSMIRASALQTHTDAAKRIDNITAIPPLYVQRRASSITIGIHPQLRSRTVPGGDPALDMFKLKSIEVTPTESGVQREFLICLDGEGNDVLVLKPQRLRLSLNSGLVTRGGVTATLTDGVTNQHRAASFTDASGVLVHEQWRVVPTWETDDLIWVVAIPDDLQIVVNPGGDPQIKPKWLDLNDDGRAWGAQRGHLEVPQSNT